MGFIKDFFSSPKPPPAPDYAGAARAQGAANVETARLEGRMNKPDIFSPYDVTRWTDLGDDRFQADYTLRPEYESQRQQQAQIGGQYLDVAGNRLGELPSGEFNFGALPAYQSRARAERAARSARAERAMRALGEESNSSTSEAI